MVRIIAAGHVNWDVTLRVASLPAPDGEAQITSQHRSGGGSAANVASALAGFDVPVGLIGSVGDDEHGFLARRELELDGVDLTGLRVVEDAATTVKYLVVDEAGEVMVLANEGANEAIGPADVDDAYVRRATHLHLTSQRPATAERLVDLAAAGDSTVSFDPGRRIDERDYGDLFDRVDILFLNDREAVEALPRDTEDPSELVQATGRVLVVKHGAAGATVFTPSGTYDHPGFGVDQVDTTGAGDAFAAGFLAVL
ncbi:MAG: carbohydrate kinase family protein, partial [Halodesulfurarchaeum sp.]